MKASVKQTLLDIVKKIKQRPSARWFIEPVDSSNDDFSDYYDVIENPMDLNTIQNKLQTDQYRTVSEFKEDLSLIWKNCQKYWQDESVTTTLAQDIKQYAESLLIYVSDRPDIDWINKLMFLADQLSDAVKPINYNIVFNNKKKSTSSPCIKQYDQTESVDDVEFTYDEIDQLRKDIQMLDSDDEQLTLLECIKSCQPKLVGQKLSLTVNLGNLQPRTIITLMNKVEQLKAAQTRSFQKLSNENA